MGLILFLASSALAADCPNVQDTIAEAWRLFDDAEVAASKALLAEANENLGCQTQLVAADDLLELYRLDGLVSLALDDPKGAVYATLRAVAADHLAAAPPPEYGPDLADLYDIWVARLKESTITLEVKGGGAVYVDGRSTDLDSPLDVVEGEHLVQVVDDMGIVRSLVADLHTDQILYTGTLAESSLRLEAVEQTVASPPEEPSRGRARPLGLAIAGVATLGLGATGVTLGYLGERRWALDPYRGETFFDCAPGTGCYADARAQAIRRDANQVRAFYGVGYGLSAVGTSLLATWALGLPVHSDGRTVGVSARF